jgi:hypothetical protein
MAYRVSDSLSDRWPMLPYTVPDGALELTPAFWMRGLQKYCDLLSAGTLSAADQVTVLKRCVQCIAVPEDCEGDEPWRLAQLSLDHLERGVNADIRLAAGQLFWCVRVCIHVTVCVCVCVRERERERE